MAEENKDLRASPKPPPLPPSLLPAPEKPKDDQRIAALEKRLADEHEKLLVANLKSQQEAANAARVEMSIKELQEKLRRDHREAEASQDRRDLAAKIQELEGRLVQERETWAAAFKNQMQGRRSEEHESEDHWRKALLAKDEELSQLRASAERLRAAELELAKVGTEKKFLDERLAELAREKIEAASLLQGAARREREFIELQGEHSLARRQCAELEADLRRVRESVQDDGKESQRLKAVAGALEKQLAAARVQSEELKRACAQGEQAQERYKAEFVVIQRRWMEREKEIRSEVAAQAAEKFQAQLSRLKLAAQEELNGRLARVAQDMRKQNEAELRKQEASLRIEMERAAMSRSEELQRLSTAQAAQIQALEEALRRRGLA